MNTDRKQILVKQCECLTDEGGQVEAGAGVGVQRALLTQQTLQLPADEQQHTLRTQAALSYTRLVSCHTGLTYGWLFLPLVEPPMRTGSECLHRSSVLLKSSDLIMLVYIT